MRIETKLSAGMTVQSQTDQMQSAGPVCAAPIFLKAKASSQRGGKLTRPSFQKGFVSEGRRTKHGLAFVIRYRVRTTEGKWVHKSETLYGLKGKKDARGILSERLRDSTNSMRPPATLTVRTFIDQYWRPYLDRRDVKP